MHKSLGDLIQTDVPERVNIEKLPPKVDQKDKEASSQKDNVQKQNLLDKIKKFIGEKKKGPPKKTNKFLLTENSGFLEQSSRISRTRLSLV